MRFIKVQTGEVHHSILLSLPPYAALGLNPIRIQRQYSQSESTNVTTSTYTILVSALAIIIDYRATDLDCLVSCFYAAKKQGTFPGRDQSMSVSIPSVRRPDSLHVESIGMARPTKKHLNVT